LENCIVATAADILTMFGNTRLPAVMDASHDKNCIAVKVTPVCVAALRIILYW